MKNHIEIKKKLTSNWFKFLQLEIVRQFQTIERNYCKENKGLQQFDFHNF